VLKITKGCAIFGLSRHLQKPAQGGQGFIALRREDGGLRALLQGNWTILNAAQIEPALKDILARAGTVRLQVDASRVRQLDTAGAWLIKHYFLNNGAAVDVTDEQRQLLDFLPEKMEHPAPEPKPGLRGAFIAIGRRVSDMAMFFISIMGFLGRIFLRFVFNFRHPRHFRIASIVRHVQDTGINALPIVSLLAFLMSMVIFYQGAIQLQKFGADIFTVDLTVISLLREMGVLITAIMVAGRSGSAFAAEIGVMKLREEVDALETLGMDPVEVLVIPRVIALVITLPLLTFVSNMVGLTGGGIMSALFLDIPLTQYIQRVDKVANLTMFFVGMVKAPVFGFLIALVGTYQGLNVPGSAESVGRQTTVAVVQSIFLVILADAVFSIVFAQAGL